MTPNRHRSHLNGRIAPIAAFAVALLVHAASLACRFNSDDYQLLRAVRDAGPFGVWSGRGAGFFRPLASVSLWIDERVYGLTPWGYHLTNLLLAALGAALVATLARRLAPASGPAMPTLAGVLFAVLPAHVEAVEWISCRGDLLAADFGFGAMILALRGGRVDRWAAAGLLALALAAKESALMVPVFLGLLAGLRRDRPLGGTAGWMLAAAAAMVALRAMVLGQLVGGYGTAVTPAGLAANLGLYLAKAVAPFSIQQAALSPLLSGPTLWVLANPRPVAILIALTVVAAALLARRHTHRMNGPGGRLAAALFLGFFVLALPALPLGMSRYTWEGSRFLYLPSVALCVLVAMALTRLRGHFAAVTLFLTLLYLGGTVEGILAWQRAGRQAQDALAAMAALPPGKVLLISVPDSYRGAYSLRNGLVDGLALLKSDPVDFVALASHMSEQPEEVPQVSPGRVTISPGPLPFQPAANPPERLRAFGAEGIAVGPYVIEVPPGSPVPRAVLTPTGLLPVP